MGDEETTSESIVSIAVVALSLGLSVSTLFIVFTFVFFKRIRSKPRDEDSFTSNPKSQAAFNKPEQVQQRINTEMSADTERGRLSKNQVPTPRLLPDLNFMLSESDSSDDSTVTEMQKNRVTFVMLPESTMDVQMRGILSPIDGSVSVVHLLGLEIRSDDEICDGEISICSSSDRMEGEDRGEDRFWV